MSKQAEAGPVSVEEMSKTPEAIAKAGWDVILTGDAYYATTQLVDKLLVSDHGGGKEGSQFLLDLRAELLRAIPVKKKTISKIVVPQ